MAPPETRSGPLGERTASKTVHLTGLNVAEDTSPLNVLQARRIARRFPMSWPVALAVADHAFAVGAPR